MCNVHVTFAMKGSGHFKAIKNSLPNHFYWDRHYQRSHTKLISFRSIFMEVFLYLISITCVQNVL